MLNGTAKFLKNMLSDVDGEISSKRIIMFLCTFALLITWGSNLWCGAKIEEFIFDGLLYIVAIALGVTTAEKFSRK